MCDEWFEFVTSEFEDTMDFDLIFQLAEGKFMLIYC